jgi:hypothetical protein
MTARPTHTVESADGPSVAVARSGGHRYWRRQRRLTRCPRSHHLPYKDGRWRFSEAPELRFVRKAWLVVDPSGYTTALLGSDAYCNDAVGFELTSDAVTGEVLQYRPGLGWVVC